ncbi:MAG TPA: S-methyl-5-thioribose-1-phosphate isomerase, partial [Planctomycetota bacterium]|nr:S-methyl-5-thioribose-1-phosphate isomerase [Planctomycetota bacterium]
MRRPRLPPTLRWRGDARTGHLELLDQTLLPGRIRVRPVRTVDALVDAIRRLAVRGAPALGVAGAYGAVLAVREAGRSRSSPRFLERMAMRAGEVALARPTAVNLRDGTLGAYRAAFLAYGRGAEAPAIAAAALGAARRLHEEDAAACLAMGRHGARLLRSGSTYLTHCNTGALATAGIGTAFAVFVAAKRAGKRITVLADETRPLLQGARLTALELAANGIRGAILPDGAAAGLIARGAVQGVFVGADRVAANGDFANKVGTYGLALAAKAHGVPFYCVAPTTTVDPGTRDGAAIPIEWRDADEVRAFAGARAAPRGFPVCNPAFDVTPARLVSALVTERGVVRAPDRRKIARL